MADVEELIGVLPFTNEEMEEYDRLAVRWCREGMAECESKWRAEGKVFAWFRDEPDWAEGALQWFWIDDPKEPCRRIFRLSLIGGGQVAVIENWSWRRWVGGRRAHPMYTWRDEDHCLAVDNVTQHLVIVNAHTLGGLVRHRGLLHTDQGDIFATAAVFQGHVPQEIADRVAQTLSAIGPQEEVFYALLDASEGCHFCRRPLRDAVSKLVGVGPDCARKHKIPHSMEAANRRLALRRKILGEQPSQ